jgi:hypothetical protein
MEEAQKLPLGHVGRREAKDMADGEYARCFQQEALFLKKWKGPNKRLSLQEAANLAGWLCGGVGSRPIKEVRVPSEMSRFMGAYYLNRTIFVRPYGLSMILIVHETTHHICAMEGIHKGGSHGEGFLMVEQMLFDWLNENRLAVGSLHVNPLSPSVT